MKKWIVYSPPSIRSTRLYLISSSCLNLLHFRFIHNLFSPSVCGFGFSGLPKRRRRSPAPQIQLQCGDREAPSSSIHLRQSQARLIPSFSAFTCIFGSVWIPRKENGRMLEVSFSVFICITPFFDPKKNVEICFEMDLSNYFLHFLGIQTGIEVLFSFQCKDEKC